jgi:hypothetical protein
MFCLESPIDDLRQLLILHVQRFHLQKYSKLSNLEGRHPST